MRDCKREREPMCETSEKGERLFSPVEILPIGLDIGRRVLEIFGYQDISNIIFRLKSNSEEINAVIDGEVLPSAELLLGIRKVTGASIDWILTGEGQRYLMPLQPGDHSSEGVPSALWFKNREREITVVNG